MKRPLALAALFLLTLLVACSNPLPPPTVSRYHFHAGQQFTGNFHQVTSGTTDIQSLASTFSVNENFQVVSVDASNQATINVTLTSFSASTANSEPVSTPTPFQFIIDSQGQIISGHAWPLLGAIQSLPASDQFCVPLPIAPLNSHLTWQAPFGHGSSGAFAASISSFLNGYPATLDATAHTPFSASGASDGITTITTGNVDQVLTCRFDLSTSQPLDIQSQVDFQFTQTITLGSSTQNLVSLGSISTSLAYTF